MDRQETGQLMTQTTPTTPTAYQIADVEIDGQTFHPGDRVIVTEATEYETAPSWAHDFPAGTSDATAVCPRCDRTAAEAWMDAKCIEHPVSRVAQSMTYNATIAGRLDTQDGTMVVLDSDDDGEVVLSFGHDEPDVIAIDLIADVGMMELARQDRAAERETTPDLYDDVERVLFMAASLYDADELDETDTAAVRRVARLIADQPFHRVESFVARLANAR
jgi:hypothetical protein